MAYDNTVFSEFIEMGFHVHIVENRNIKVLSEKLTSIVESIEAEQQQSAPNRALAQDLFSKEREKKAWERLLI